MTKTIEIKPTVSKNVYLTDFQYITVNGLGIDEMTRVNQFLIELAEDILSVHHNFSPKCTIDIIDNIFQIKLGVSYPFLYNDTIFCCDLSVKDFDNNHLGKALNKWQESNEFVLFMDLDKINKLFKNVRLFEKTLGFQEKIIESFKKRPLSVSSIYNPYMFSFFEISYSFEDYSILLEDSVNMELFIMITPDNIAFKTYKSKDDFDLNNEVKFIDEFTKHFISFYPENMLEYKGSLPDFIKTIEMQRY